MSLALCLLIVLLLLAPGARRGIRIGVVVAPARAAGSALLLLVGSVPIVLFLPAGARAGFGAPTGTVRHYHLDHLGSTQALTDASGSLVEQIRYRPYGEIRGRFDGGGAPISPTELVRLEFTGYESERHSGLQYAGARFYDPELGQFLSHDPAGQFASPYAYGPGDPVNGRDPTGQDFVTIVFVLALVAAAARAIQVGVETGDFGAAYDAFGISLTTNFLASAAGGLVGKATAGLAEVGTFGASIHYGVQLGSLGYGGYTTVQAARDGDISTAGIGALNFALSAYGISQGLAGESICAAISGDGIPSQGREGTGPATDLATAEKNVAEAAPNVIRDLKSGKLNIGLEERTLEGGFDAIKFKAVDDVPGVAGIEYKVWQGLDGERFGDVLVTIDRQGAVTLGETYRSIGHELGHLVPRVRALSPIPPPGMSRAFSPQERAAERIGTRVGKHFGF